MFLHKIVILINKAKSLEQCLCRVKCDPVHIYCPESSTGPSPGPPTGLPAQAIALGLPKNSKYLSVLVEKLVLAGRALRVFAGEKQKQLADKFVSNQEQFSGFTICVGKIFFLPEVIKTASFIHEKGRRGNFSKEPLSLNPPPMAHDFYPQRNE